MRALEPEVFDTVFAAIKPLLPVRAETHPLGCHRRRVPDRDCFEVMLVHLVTGSSWEDCERLCGNKVSDTTVRARRDEWEMAGVFDAIAAEAITAYDKIIGLDLSEVAVDGSLHKSPAGGEGTGKNPTDRAKLGWKWSILTDAKGIPIGWTIDGANRWTVCNLAHIGTPENGERLIPCLLVVPSFPYSSSFHRSQREDCRSTSCTSRCRPAAGTSL